MAEIFSIQSLWSTLEKKINDNSVALTHCLFEREMEGEGFL
jgi:hypothetical protein